MSGTYPSCIERDLIEDAIKNASTGQLSTQLIKNCVYKSALISRVAALDIEPASKMAMLEAADGARGIRFAFEMADRISKSSKKDGLSKFAESIDWDAVTKTLDAQFDKSPQSTTEGCESKKSWVYFIESKSTGLVKIGRSVDPNQRFAAIRTMSPDELTLLGTIPEAEVAESELHKKFSHLRKHGEWFEFGSEIHNFIDSFQKA